MSLIAMAVLTFWVLGTVVFLLRIGCSAWSLRRVESSLRPVTTGPVVAAMQETASELGLHSPVLYFGVAGAMPMVWGIRCGRILLPPEATKWDAGQLRAVLLHELAHLRRYDPLALVIARLARALHWFNPLVWLAVNRLQVEQERACDDYVLRGGVNPSDYAGHLLDLATRLEPVPIASVALAMTDRPKIEGRLRIILDATRNRRKPSSWFVGLTVLFVASATISLAMLHAAEDQSPNVTRIVLVESHEATFKSPVRIRLIASADGNLVANGIFLEDRPIKGMVAFKKELEKIAAGQKDGLAIVIEADSSLRYQHLEQVVNTASRAGFTKIELKSQLQRRAENSSGSSHKETEPATGTAKGKAKVPAEKLEKDRERRNVLRELLAIQLELLKGGKTSLDLVLTTHRELLQVELELAEKSAERIEVSERLLKTLLELEEVTKQLFESGVASSTEYLATKAARLKAQADLIRERAEVQP